MKVIFACFTLLFIQDIATSSSPKQQDVASVIKGIDTTLKQFKSKIIETTNDRITLTHMVESWLQNSGEYVKLLEGGNATPEQVAAIAKAAENFAAWIKKTEALEVLLINDIGRAMIKTLKEKVASPLTES